MMAVRTKTPIARASHVGARAGIVLGAVAGAAGISATGNPALAVEEGETLPTAEMRQELQDHNMRIYGTGDFTENLEGGDTPNDPTDDSVDLKIAIFAATSDGGDVWILKGDTPKSADTSNDFTVVEKARNLRIVDNEGTPQEIPYDKGLHNPKANQFCQMLTDAARAPEGFDYFLENEINRCTSFEQVMQRGADHGRYIYAQALSEDELEDGKMTQTVLTIRNDKTLGNSTGFTIDKSFVGTGVTHPLHPVDGGIHMEWTQHAERLENAQQRHSQ